MILLDSQSNERELFGYFGESSDIWKHMNRKEKNHNMT